MESMIVNVDSGVCGYISKIGVKKANCHPPCLVPTSVAKVVEVIWDLALPQDASIVFKT